MTERQSSQAWMSLWDTEWETLHPGSRPDPVTKKPDTSQPLCVPYCFENEVFSTDDLGPLGCWVRLQWRPATDTQTTQGPIAMNEVTGVLMVQVFAPLNEGTAKLLDLCDDIRTVFKRRQSGELRTFDAASTAIANDGTWAMRVVTVEVRYTYTA